MADAIISAKRQILLLKMETTSGTDSVPTAASNAILASNFSVTPEADKIGRPVDRPYFGGFRHTLANFRVVIEFDFEMVGSSTVGNAPPIGPVLRACGHAQTLNASTSAVYNPISSSFETCSIYFQRIDPNDQTKVQNFAVLGCMGTIEWEKSIGGYPKGRARFLGTWVDPTNPALTNPTLSGFQDPPAVTMSSWAVTLDSFAINTRSLKLTQAAEQQFHEGSERKATITMDRRPTFELTVYDPGTAKNIWGLMTGNNAVVLSSVVNGGAGKIITLGAPVVQLDLVRWAEINGAQGLTIPLVACPSSGNDEYLWTFT